MKRIIYVFLLMGSFAVKGQSVNVYDETNNIKYIEKIQKK
jgi:hypothetical protein